MYAVLETGSKQYRVTAGDRLEVDLLGAAPGESVTFDRVLLVSNDGRVSVGTPTLANASVLADVVEHIRGEKKIAFKMKRRKGYHKTIGHRQELTVVKIKEIKSRSNSQARGSKPAGASGVSLWLMSPLAMTAIRFLSRVAAQVMARPNSANPPSPG